VDEGDEPITRNRSMSCNGEEPHEENDDAGVVDEEGEERVSDEMTWK
jgi:hypothetical protein